MKDRTVRIIIFVSAIALVGLVFMQLYWILNAFSLNKQQFDHRATLAISDALKDIEKSDLGRPDSTKGCCLFPCGNDSLQPAFIQTDVLDSLLKVHFTFHNLDTIYDFAIVKSINDSLLYAKKKINFKTETGKCHKAGLSKSKYLGCYNVEVHFPKKNEFILLQMLSWLIASVLFIMVIIFSFLYIIITIVRQKKISEMKNDFINNMTHELKTPISTISMASEVLLKSDSGLSKERSDKYAKIIYDENLRLHLLVDRVLKISELDKKNYSLQKESVDFHRLIRSTISQMCLDQIGKSVNIIYNLQAKTNEAVVDKIHMTSILSNLIDNAIKYSGDNSEIIITTCNVNNGISVTIKDNGIGISKELQKHIFEKFYRVHTGDLHDIKGFGLGLYYVKTLVELHEGTISVKSELGKGSEFIVVIPFKTENN